MLYMYDGDIPPVGTQYSGFLDSTHYARVGMQYTKKNTVISDTNNKFYF